MKTNPRSQSGILTTRSLPVFLLCLIGASISLLSFASTPFRSIVSSPAFSSLPNCTLPGVQVQNDDTGDQTGGPDANSQLDLQAVYVAEPFYSATDHNITFTIKVANLSGGPQPSSNWAVYMNVQDTNGSTRTIFFDMNTIDSPTGDVGFNYGYSENGNDTSQGPGSVITGSFTDDGTITLKVNTA